MSEQPSKPPTTKQNRFIKQDKHIKADEETIIPSNSTINIPGIDFHLESEIAKACISLYNFKAILNDQTIPSALLANAKGVVFLTILKAGFIFAGIIYFIYSIY